VKYPNARAKCAGVCVLKFDILKAVHQLKGSQQLWANQRIINGNWLACWSFQSFWHLAPE
jgi:hypothetical protein